MTTEQNLKLDIHSNLCNSIHELYERKNHDYGDSFAQVRREVPNAILVRLSDKLNRLKSLMNKSSQEVKDESVDDTLMDLANYALLELVERRYERDKEPHEDCWDYAVRIAEEIEAERNKNKVWLPKLVYQGSMVKDNGDVEVTYIAHNVNDVETYYTNLPEEIHVRSL